MKLRSIQEIKEKKEELEKEKTMFYKFLNDVFEDEKTAGEMNKHLWRICKQIEILNWVLDDELPF